MPSGCLILGARELGVWIGEWGIHHRLLVIRHLLVRVTYILVLQPDPSTKHPEPKTYILNLYASGNRLIAYSANAVMVRLGFTPRFDGITDPSTTYIPG